MANEQLLGYIRREMRNHVPLFKLRQDLGDRQWPCDEIEDALRIVANEQIFQKGGCCSLRQDYAADGFVMTGRQAPAVRPRSFSFGKASACMMAVMLVIGGLLFLYARYAVHAKVMQGAEISSFDNVLENVFSSLLE